MNTLKQKNTNLLRYISDIFQSMVEEKEYADNASKVLKTKGKKR